MTYLWAVIALVGALAVLNLLITLALVRRLREHEARRAGAGEANDFETVRLRPGDRIGEFKTTDVDGRSVSDTSMVGRTLVAFFSPACEACVEKVPAFAERAAERVGGRDKVITVVLGDGPDSEQLVDQLHAGTRAVVEPYDGPISRAFGVIGFPAYLIVEKSHVIAASADVGGLVWLDPAPVEL